MSSDFVIELRRASQDLRDAREMQFAYFCDEAADEIQRLREEVQVWRKLATNVSECGECEKLPIDEDCGQPDCAFELYGIEFAEALRKYPQ